MELLGISFGYPNKPVFEFLHLSDFRRKNPNSITALLTFADIQGSFSWAEDLTILFVELSQRPERSIEDIVGEPMDAILSQFSEARGAGLEFCQ